MESVGLLGPAAAVTREGTVVGVRLRPKALALLARLVGEPRWHSRAELADILFPDAADARAQLRWYLSHLRDALPPGLATGLDATSERVRWSGPSDVAAFRAGGPLDLFRGDLASDLRTSVSAAFDTWLCIEQESLRTLFRRRTLEAAASPRVADRERTAKRLATLVAVDPYCEDAHLLLIDALEALGRRTAADQARERYERTVREELGSEPRGALRGRGLPREDFVPVGTVTLHIVEWPGSDPPLLAIHGSAMSCYSLTGLAEQLSPPNRVIAVDLRGHCLSDKPATGYGIDRMADDVAGLVRALGGPPPVLAGFSVGGAVATLAAQRCEAAGLVLLDAVVGDRALVDRCATVLPAIAAGLDATYQGIDAYTAGWSAPSANRRLARLELSPMPDGSFRRRALRAALAEMWSSAATTDTLPALAAVDCPVLVVSAALPWIGGQAYVPAECARLQADTARRAELVVAGGSDHAGTVRAPEPVVVEALGRFLAETRPSLPARGDPSARLSEVDTRTRSARV